MLNRSLHGILALILLSTSLAVGAQTETVGKVVLSIGKNTAQLPEQLPRILKRKSPLFSLDTLQTGSKGQLQIRFSDNSRLSLRQDTVFKIENYVFDKQKPEQGASRYRLIKGGLRTITGAISDANTENYNVHTPIATIGVRGTHYSLFYCDKSCKGVLRAKEGLYGYVLEGEIIVKTDSVRAPVKAGKYFFIGKEGNRLQISKTPFDVFENLRDLGPNLLNMDTGGAPGLEIEPDKTRPYDNPNRR